MDDTVQFEHKKLLAVLAVLTFGLTALTAVLGLGSLVPVIFVLGFFVIVPLVALLGDSLPFVESDGSDSSAVYESADASADAAQDDPVRELRSRYARGELSDEEFERRLERLLETEELERHLEAERERGTRESDRAFEYE